MISMSLKLIEGWYLRMKAKMIPAYVINGVMMLVDESATRNAAATKSGVMAGLTKNSIGIKMGPNSIHLEVSPPIKILIIAVVKTKPINSSTGKS